LLDTSIVSSLAGGERKKGLEKREKEKKNSVFKLTALSSLPIPLLLQRPMAQEKGGGEKGKRKDEKKKKKKKSTASITRLCTSVHRAISAEGEGGGKLLGGKKEELINLVRSSAECPQSLAIHSPLYARGGERKKKSAEKGKERKSVSLVEEKRKGGGREARLDF